MKNIFAKVLLFVAAFGLALSATSQTSQGALSGTARDASGAMVSGASVTILNEATGQTREISTNQVGVFRADALQPGLFTVRVSKTGFKIAEIKHLQVNPSIVTSYDIQLTVAGTAQEVVVEAASTATLDLDTGGLSSTISNSNLKSMPIFTLNPVELAITLPGVQLVKNGAYGNGYSFSVNGSRTRGNNFLIDGQDNNDNGIAGQALQAQIPDMYDSVSVLTNSYSSEFGRAGGAVVNMVTRSGTNTPHGSAWDLYVGSGLDAIDGQSRGAGITKTRYDQHNFGFTAGAPLLRNKLFVFGGAQWERYYGSTTAGNIGLPAATDIVTLTGGSTTNTYAYLTSLAATNAPAALLMKYIGSMSQYNLVSSSSPTSVVLANEANCTSCTLHFFTYKRPPSILTSTDTQWTTKVDYQITQKDHLAVRYLHDYSFYSPDWGNFSTQLPGFDSYQGGPASQAGGDYTHVFSPTLLNEFRASATRIIFSFGELPATIANSLYKKPLITISNTGLPTLGPASTSLPQGRGHDFYQFQDTVSRTWSRHTLRIGADVGRVLVRDFVPFNNYGTLTYNKSTGYSALNNYLDDYLGSSGAATINFGSNRLDSHQWQTAYFVQDDVKLTPDFSLNVGVRYEFQTNPENALKYPAIHPATVLTDTITTKYTVKPDKNNIAPRLGFAYNPHGGPKFLADGKTVYHIGAGIFYDVMFTNMPDNSLSSAPNVEAPQVTSTSGRGIANASAQIPAMAPTGTIKATNSVTSMVDNMVNPITYQWNLGIERQMPGDVKLTLTYVGTRGSKLFANQQYNYYVNGTRMNAARGPIVARGNFADSSYNGLQVGASHAMRHGVTVQASYTYSKNLDDGSEVFTVSSSSPTSYSANLAPGGRSREWGNSAYDFRQYLSLSYVWNLPDVPKLSNATGDTLVDLIIRKWQFSAVNLWQAGQYSTFNLNGADMNLDGSSANDRPLVGGNPSAPFSKIAVDGGFWGCPSGYYDLAKNNATGECTALAPKDAHFYIPYPYTAGQMTQEIGRNSYRNPGYWNMDAALQKSFALHLPKMENSAFQLRAEAQHLFNHNNIGPESTNLFYATGTGATDPFLNRHDARRDDNRSLRIWAKFIF